MTTVGVKGLSQSNIERLELSSVNHTGE